jgi:hypothetical protein
MTGQTANRTQVERSPRVRINVLHDLEFVALAPKFSAPLKIDNISSQGMGLIFPADADFASLTTLTGELQFADANYPLILRIVRFNGDHVGAVIENPSTEYLQSLQNYFEGEIVALKLRPTRSDYLKPVPNGTPHWYHGSNNCDLSYVSNGNEVVEFALSAFGHHVEGGTQKPLRFSEISEKAPGETAGYKASILLEPLNGPDTEMLNLAKRVIRAVESLPADHRDAILKFLD